jgi:hypothetical protein
MRLLILCCALFLGLSLAAPASAQGFPPGPWRGVWVNTDHQSEYRGELDFTVELNGRVQGQIRWMLVRSPQHEQQARIGARGVEYVEGTFDIDTGALNLRGTRVDDPTLIGVDEYRLIVSPNGQHIVGMTRDQGTWGGRMELTRFGP